MSADSALEIVRLLNERPLLLLQVISVSGLSDETAVY